MLYPVELRMRVAMAQILLNLTRATRPPNLDVPDLNLPTRKTS